MLWLLTDGGEEEAKEEVGVEVGKEDLDGIEAIVQLLFEEKDTCPFPGGNLSSMLKLFVLDDSGVFGDDLLNAIPDGISFLFLARWRKEFVSDVGDGHRLGSLLKHLSNFSCLFFDLLSHSGIVLHSLNHQEKKEDQDHECHQIPLVFCHFEFEHAVERQSEVFGSKVLALDVIIDSMSGSSSQKQLFGLTEC